MKKLLLLATLLAPIALIAQTGGKLRELAIYTTAKDTDLRMSAQDKVLFKSMPQPLETQPCVFVDPDKKFQSFIGIGGAITDAAAETFAKLPAQQQEALLRAYYDKDKGLGYTIARTNIHSCDFSSGSYTYVTAGDVALKSFSVAHDRQYRIPMIKRAIAAAGGKLTLFASPWSPPAWMKNNNNMLQGGKLKPEYYQAWANYFVRFIRAYEKEGIPVWGVTIQNEPMAKQTWESCIFTAEEELHFLKNYLGPTFKKQGLADKKIIGWDHNRDLIYQRASTLLADHEARKYLWGIGYHWYEDWSGGNQLHQNVKMVKDAYPDVNLLFTEGCNGPFQFDSMFNWRLGEAYGRSVINDFNNGCVGWTDWNILLDERGGPNHVKNFCFAPVHANTTTGELYFTNEYYYIGHFSRFIRPGARRVVSTPSRSVLESTAFINKDGKLAVVVMNRSSQPVDYHLWIKGQAAELTALPHSISTLIVAGF